MNEWSSANDYQALNADVEAKLAAAIALRKQRATLCNHMSSRSHFIIQIYLDFGLERPHGRLQLNDPPPSPTYHFLLEI